MSGHAPFCGRGDSRAVLCRSGVAVPMSEDHKPASVTLFDHFPTPALSFTPHPILHLFVMLSHPISFRVGWSGAGRGGVRWGGAWCGVVRRDGVG